MRFSGSKRGRCLSFSEDSSLSQMDGAVPFHLTLRGGFANGKARFLSDFVRFPSIFMRVFCSTDKMSVLLFL